MAHLKTVLLLATGMSVALPGCGSSSKCTPEELDTCTCSSGKTGTRICREDRTWSACSCDESGTDAKVLLPEGSVRDGGFEGKRIFVTSATFNGSLVTAAPSAANGLAAGDALCQVAAEGALLGGTWKAWLSTYGTNAIDRIADKGPWFLLDGTRVFNNKANLAGTPLSGIRLDEHGSGVFDFAWTGTASGGAAADDSCGGWTDASSLSFGEEGSLAADSTWTSYARASCSGKKHLLCIEQ